MLPRSSKFSQLSLSLQQSVVSEKLMFLCFLLKPNTLHCKLLDYSWAREQTEYYMKREREKKSLMLLICNVELFSNITVMVTVHLSDVKLLKLDRVPKHCVSVFETHGVGFFQTWNEQLISVILTTQGLHQSHNRLLQILGLMKTLRSILVFLTGESLYKLSQALQCYAGTNKSYSQPATNLFWDYDFVCSAAGRSIR